jgi:parallel beta-helix repeat protein
VGMQFYYSNCTISANNVTGNDEGIVYYNSNCLISGNNVTGNLLVDTLVMDTAGVVMQNNIWNCGPASLATVLNKLGVNATQDDLASLAGTDYTGTTMAGLVYAAEVKGLNQSITAAGMLITSVDQLKPNNIVLLTTVSGLYHYCIITNITNTTVFLADSELGNINMTIGNFTSVYTGYALVVTNDTNNTQFNNGSFLSYNSMTSIKGTMILPIFTSGAFPDIDKPYSRYEYNPPAWWEYLGFGWMIYNSIPKIYTCYDAPLVSSTSLNEGYSYSYSTYSYRHGYRTRSYASPVYTPYVPPVYTISYWGLTSDGSWGLITTTTTGNPDELKNQKITEAYNQKKASELAKIAGIISQYVSNDNDYVLAKMEKNYKEGEDKLDKLISGNDPRDPKKWMERLRNALNKAVTKKKWTTVATLTAIGSLWASYYALKTFLNHK